MLLCVATHSYLFTLDLDEEFKIRQRSLLSRGYHYGIGLRDEKKTGVASELIVYRGGKSDHDQRDRELLLFERNDGFHLAARHKLADHYGFIHQIAWRKDGLFLANTKYNSVSVIDAGGNRIDDFIFDGVQHDYNHVNSVFPCGREVLVLLHNRHRIESELAVLAPGVGGHFEMKRRLSLWDECCHNIFADEHILAYNASTARKFVIVDLKEDRQLQRLSFEGLHTKGLSVTKDHFIIGLSEHTFRDKRSTSCGYLAFIDRTSFEQVAFIDLNSDDLPTAVGNINEIRCISELDLAHSRQTPLQHNWQEAGLAWSNPIRMTFRRARTKALIPVRAVKAFFAQNPTERRG